MSWAQLWITASLCLCFSLKKSNKTNQSIRSLTLRITEFNNLGLRLCPHFDFFKPFSDIFKCAYHVGGERRFADTAVQIKWHQILRNKPETQKREAVGSDFRSLETTLTSQEVSYRIALSFSTFQTHIKVLQLYFWLQDRFYTHHWFCHFFKPFYGSKCLPLCLYRTKLLFYSFFSFGCYI